MIYWTIVGDIVKVNNKGFAITTLIYGLAILVLLLITIIMATLSSMRSNIKDMAVKVEEELLSLSSSSVEYSKTDITNICDQGYIE